MWQQLETNTADRVESGQPRSERKGSTVKKVLVGILVMACASALWAQASQDVPKDHWAYESVNYLMGKGYIAGFSDGSFGGNRAMTRYEFATVIKRILDDSGARISAAEEAIKAKQEAPTPPAVTREDLVQINKLVDEFKPELIVIGARLDKVEAALAELKSSFERVNAIMTDPEGTFETIRSDVGKLKKVTVNGYVQARYNTFQADLNSPTAAKPASNFSVRRARLKVTGKPTRNSLAVIQIDGGQNYQGTFPPAVSVKDAYVEYNFAGDASLGISMLMGQMKWPFGYEVVQSSAVRESPERSLIVQRLFPGERDRGFCVIWPFQRAKYIWKIGVFNGAQASQVPPTSAKAGVTTLRARLGDVDLGVSAWFGKDVEGSDGKLYSDNKAPKVRYGADAEWYLNNLALKAEYIAGVGVDGADPIKPFNPAVLDTSVNGGWAQVAWNFMKANTLAVKYETMSEDPLYPQFGRRSAWDLGLLHWLDDKTRVKLYYIINQEEKQSFPNNAYIAEWITVF